MPDISVVIPTLNEAENIYPLFTRIFETAESSGLALEVVVVDDSSTDSTREQVRKWQGTHPVKLVCRDSKDGLASAVIEGARAAAGRIVVVMDADLSHPPEVLPEVVKPIVDGTHDMVIGSRYTEGGSTPDWPLTRKMASRLATIPARVLTDPHDPLAGYFAVWKGNLADLDTSVSGFKIGLEVLVAGGGKLRVAEVPITFYDRYKGKSKMNKNIIFDYFFQVLALIGASPSASFKLGIFVAAALGGLLDFSTFAFLQRVGFSIISAEMASFLVAAVATACIHSRWTFAGKGPLSKHKIGYLVVCLLTLVLRGGFLEDLLRLGCPVYPAMLLTIPATVAAMVLGPMFFVFSGAGDRPSADVRARIFCIGIVVFSIVVRIVYLGLPALLEEEAYYWNYARHPALGYLDHPLMVALLIRVGTFLFGTTEFGVRFMAPVCWLITAGFTFALTRCAYGRLAAFRSVMLLSVLPVFFFVGMLMTPDAPLTACWSGVLYFLYKALVHGKPKAWIGVGIFLGLGMISKYTLALMGPAIVLYILLDPESRKWIRRPEPYLAVIIALVIFSPVIAWNFQHGWASFVFQGEKRVTGPSEFSTHILLGQILLLLTPTGAIGVLSFFFGGRAMKTAGSPKDAKLGQRTFLFFLLSLAAPLAVFFFFSLSREVKLNWTGPVWLAAVPFLAATMNTAGENNALLRWSRRWWPATAVIVMLLLGAGLHYYSEGLPGAAIYKRPFLTGWDNLARDIDRIVATESAADGKRPVVVGMDKYKIASGLAFYRYKDLSAAGAKQPSLAVKETLSRHVFGGNGLMYEFWFPPSSLEGKDMLVVSSSWGLLDGDVIGPHAQSMGEVRELDIRKDGATIDHCFIRLVRGYHAK